MAAAGAAATILSAGGTAAAGTRLPAGCAASGATVTCAFSFTGAEQAFAVPPGVTSVQVTATGAAGSQSIVGPTGAAGAGAQVTGTVAVSGGTTLFVEVGGTPTTAGCAGGGHCVGGFNGGGSAGITVGAGGGASDVRTTGMPLSGPQTASLNSRLIVAGGGGGSGQRGFCGSGHGTPTGGSGGDAGASGGGGSLCTDHLTGISTGGGAGTQSGGGDGGISQNAANTGATGFGAAGSLGTGAAGVGTGGGGGGGYYGGGSGAPQIILGTNFELQAASGGGGGSSYVPAGGTSSVTTSPASVTISYARTGSPVADVAVQDAGPHAAAPGSRFTETIGLSGAGPGAALGIVTTLVVPRQLTVISAPGMRSHRGGVLRWASPFLAAGGHLSYKVTLKAGRHARGRVRLSVSIMTGSFDPSPRNSTATITVRLG
jgi:Glycine rich protein/Domain of unknown function DUF11